jgi:predicted ester cyclase
MPGPSNLQILARYSTRMLAGDYDAVFEFFAPDFSSHVTGRVNPDAVGTDIRPYERTFWETAKAAFPDMNFAVGPLIESGDLVVSHWTLTGTHSGAPYYDVPPSGAFVTIAGTAILRFRDGRIVEHWGGPHCMKGVGLVAGAADSAGGVARRAATRS